MESLKVEQFPTFDLSAPSSPRRPLLPDTPDFEFSGHLLPNLTLPAADELFDGGVIRPLKPSPRPPKPTNQEPGPFKPTPKPGRGRSKEPDPGPATTRNRNRNSRSVSPLRVSEFALHQSSIKSTSSSTSSTSSLSSSSSLKWRLKDFLLFRSASEGRATAAAAAKVLPPLKRSSVSSALLSCVGSSYVDDNDSSFRYAIGDGEGSVSGSLTRPRSAHGLHYYRAMEEEEKKDKVMDHPYKQRLLDCMGLTV